MRTASVTVTPSSTSTIAPQAVAVAGDASRKRRAAASVISGTCVPAGCACATERDTTPGSFRERYRSARNPRLGHGLDGWAGGCVPGSSAVTQAAIRSATSAGRAALVSNDGVMRARSHAANRWCSVIFAGLDVPRQAGPARSRPPGRAAYGGLDWVVRMAALAGQVATMAEDRGGGDDRGQRQRLTGQVGAPGPDVLAEQEHPEHAGRQRVEDGEPGLRGG